MHHASQCSSTLLCMTVLVCFVRPIDAVGEVSLAKASVATVAGTGHKENNEDRGPALQTNIGQTFGVELGPDDHLYICEVENHRIRRLDRKTKQVTTVAGNGQQGYTGDGGAATAAAMNEPYEVRFDGDGNLFIVEMQNHCVRRVDASTKTITTVAGTGEAGFGGDDGAAIKAQLNRPHSIAIHNHQLFIADIGNHRIRCVDLASGMIRTIAGNGGRELPQPGHIDGQPLVGPRALYATRGMLWIALREGHSVWKLDLSNHRLSHIAGNGKKGYTGDGGAATLATFHGPKGIVVDAHDRVFVVDTENQVIRQIDTDLDRIITVAGNGKRGFAGDGGFAIEAEFDRPHGICLDSRGVLYVGDTNNHRVRAIQMAGEAAKQH